MAELNGNLEAPQAIKVLERGQVGERRTQRQTGKSKEYRASDDATVLAAMLS